MDTIATELPPKVIEKFWANVVKGQKIWECWSWSGRLGKTKSPIMLIAISNQKTVSGHQQYKEFSGKRISLQLSGVNILSTAQTYNTCNNRLCLNPLHLIHGNVARFWNRVIKFSEAKGGCWEWFGCHDKDRYGKFTYYENGKKITIRAHVYSMMIHLDLPRWRALKVCHTCDNPPCVNPDHLFLGTNKENVDDKCQKGRQARGETCGRSKLTVEQVKQIRKLRIDTGISYPQLGKKFNITGSNAYSIVKRETWKHIP